MPSNDSHRVLLVEDDHDIAEELECILDALGYECTHVETRDDAERAAAECDFCLVLMDLQIKASSTTLAPKIEAGRTLLERLRRQYPERLPNATFRTPILVLSAHTQGREETVRLMGLGASDVLEKPLANNHPSLDVRLADALERSRREDHDACSSSGRPPDELVIDVKTRRVNYCGIDVPTAPVLAKNGRKSRHLQKQAFGVLVALAQRPGERVSATKLDELLYEQDLLDDKVGSNLSAIKSRIVGAFEDAVAGTHHATQVRSLLLVSRGTLALTFKGPVTIFGASSNGARVPALSTERTAG